MIKSRVIYRWMLVAVLSACTLTGQVGCRSGLQRGGFSGLTPPNQPLVAPPPQGTVGKVKEAAAETARVAGLAIVGVLYLGLCLWADDDDEDGFS